MVGKVGIKGLGVCAFIVFLEPIVLQEYGLWLCVAKYRPAKKRLLLTKLTTRCAKYNAVNSMQFYAVGGDLKGAITFCWKMNVHLAVGIQWWLFQVAMIYCYTAPHLSLNLYIWDTACGKSAWAATSKPGPYPFHTVTSPVPLLSCQKTFTSSR